MDAHGVEEYFSGEEIARLQAGLPDLRQWSSKMLIPFQGGRLRHPSIAWINRRWFSERDFDVSDEAVFGRISAWLLADFAYIAIATDNQVLAGDTRTLYADRYGSSTGLSTHGGSGRVPYQAMATLINPGIIFL